MSRLTGRRSPLQPRTIDRTPEVLEERLVARGVPFGTPERIQSRLAELEALGITRLYLQAGTTDPGRTGSQDPPLSLGERHPVGFVVGAKVVSLHPEVGHGQQLVVDDQVAKHVAVLDQLAGRAQPGTVDFDRH